MRATISCYCPSSTSTSTSTSSISPSSRQFNLPIKLPNSRPPQLGFSNFNTGSGLGRRRSEPLICGAFNGGSSRRAATKSSMSVPPSPWDDKPYEVLPGGRKSYLDEQDVVSFLDPPKNLIPLDPSSFNPAAYLQKKIADIPKERRHRLLSLLNPGLISKAWAIAGTRYEDPKLVKRSSSGLLGSGDGVKSLEFWNCRTSGGPMAIAWINSFKKALFRNVDGRTYGRIIGGSVLSKASSASSPLYFMVKRVTAVMSTEQPCDFAYEFGDGLLDLQGYPEGFPKPEEHPWPFSDQFVMYVRNVGPGVLVGQAWQEGEELEVVPKKLCGEILMVKDYAASDGTWSK